MLLSTISNLSRLSRALNEAFCLFIRLTIRAIFWYLGPMVDNRKSWSIFKFLKILLLVPQHGQKFQPIPCAIWHLVQIILVAPLFYNYRDVPFGTIYEAWESVDPQ